MIKMDNLPNSNTILNRLLRLVDLALQRSEYGPAYAHLSVLLDIFPDLKDNFKHKFIINLCKFIVYIYYLYELKINI